VAETIFRGWVVGYSSNRRAENAIRKKIPDSRWYGYEHGYSNYLSYSYSNVRVKGDTGSVARCNAPISIRPADFAEHFHPVGLQRRHRHRLLCSLLIRMVIMTGGSIVLYQQLYIECCNKCNFPSLCSLQSPRTPVETQCAIYLQ